MSEGSDATTNSRAGEPKQGRKACKVQQDSAAQIIKAKASLNSSTLSASHTPPSEA